MLVNLSIKSKGFIPIRMTNKVSNIKLEWFNYALKNVLDSKVILHAQVNLKISNIKYFNNVVKRIKAHLTLP